MTNTPFFSIIIPIYNAERFLSQTLESVLEQSYEDYELILVDDGSTDKSKDVCKRYSESDNRIVFISKCNEGVSITRNRALDIAKGEYVFFVDADDIVYKDALRNIYNEIKKHSSIDYLRFEYKTIDENGNNLYPNYESRRRRRIERNILNSADCIKNIVRNEFFLWSGIFKKSIIDEYNVRFLDDCTYNEDTLFMIQFFCHSKSHLYISDILYGYRKFDGAVTSKFSEKNYNDVRTVFYELCGIYNDKDSDFKKALKNVIERIGLRLYNQKAYFNIENPKDKSVFEFCLISPILLEWKLINILRINIAVKSFPLINFARKIIRRIA